jgi:hypothetical protein
LKLATRELARRATSVSVQLMVLTGLPLAALARFTLGLLREPRISYWTGTPILTLAQKAASERLLGQRAITMVRFTYRISHDFDVVLARWCGGHPWLLYPLTGLAFLALLATASRVHTFADGGLLPAARRRRVATAELLAYRLFRIPHMVWTYGADVRTREVTMALGQPNCCTDCTQVNKACICDAGQGDRNIARLRANGAMLFSMGDMIEYTPGSRNDLFFWPLDLAGSHASAVQTDEVRAGKPAPLRVVHAPNHREFKGTRYLEAAVADLQAEGVPIELMMVEKLPNHEALAIYRTADVIFDQCLIGFHGYFVLEAMALGKPVMCYIRKPEQYLLEPQECPIINTHVDTLRDDLRRLVMTRDQLTSIGQRGRAYVERHYSREAFAGRLQRAYQEIGITT